MKSIIQAASLCLALTVSYSLFNPAVVAQNGNMPDPKGFVVPSHSQGQNAPNFPPASRYQSQSGTVFPPASRYYRPQPRFSGAAVNNQGMAGSTASHNPTRGLGYKKETQNALKYTNSTKTAAGRTSSSAKYHTVQKQGAKSQ